MLFSYLRFIFLFSLFAVSIEANNSLGEVKIIQPKDMTLYNGELATVVIEISNKSVDTIKFLLDNNIIQELNVTKGKITYCETIKIHPAKNIITIATYSKEKKLQESKLNLFYLPELFEGLEDDAEEYDLNFFHTNEEEKKCVSCHNMTSNIPTGEDVFEDVSQTTCFDCHKSKLNTRNTHAPAANWRCIDCHDGKAGEYNIQYSGESKYLVPDPINRSCESCHDNLAGWDYNRYTHGPVNDGRCIRCHDPHGSDNEFFLRKSIWELCTTCHSEKALKQHVIPQIGFGRKTVDGGHPTRGREDPARPGRELTCTGCHNPHGSDGIYLLRMKGSMTFGVCQRCHKK